MMEIVHDMAPDARLAFAGPNTSVEMARAILWLANDAFDGEGADVVVDDLGFLLQPYFEDGIVAQAAADAVDGGPCTRAVRQLGKATLRRRICGRRGWLPRIRRKQ